MDILLLNGRVPNCGLVRRVRERRCVHVGALILLAVSLFTGLVRAQVDPGTALRFDGATTYLSIPNNAAFNAYPLTVSAWVRTTNQDVNVRAIASKYLESSLNGWAVFMYAGRLRAWYFRNSSNYIWDGAQGLDGGNIADGHWHHVAFVVDASGAQLFVDGTRTAARAWTGLPGAPSSTEPLQLGRYWTYPTTFQGDMDEISIWNQALDTNTVNYIKHRRLTGSEDGQVALWHLDEGSGTTTADATPAARTATLIGGPQWVTSSAPIALAPVAGRALKLDGVDDQVIIPHDTALNAFPFTAMLWVKTSQATGIYPAMAGKYQVNSVNGWGVALNQGRLHCWYYRASGSGLEPGYTSSTDRFIANGQWHHVAFVVDANSGRLFIDGQLVRTEPWTGTPGATTSTADMRLGSYVSSLAFLNGLLDHVSVWNTAMSQDDIVRYSHAPLTGTEPSLVAAYETDEASGTAVVDLTGAHSGIGQGGFLRTGSVAGIGDGSQHALATVDQAYYTRLWAIGTSPTASTFPIPTIATIRRFHDYGDAPAPIDVTATLSASLVDNLGQPASLTVPAQNVSTFTLPSENANAPPTNSRVNISTTINVDPVQLESATKTYGAVLQLTTQPDVFDIRPATLNLPVVRLLDFNGTLFFGTLETRFSSVANTPSPGLIGGGAVASLLQINNNSGYLLAKPSYRFGNGITALGVNLFDDGHALATSGSLNINGPAPDAEVLNGITFERTGVTISANSGSRAAIILRYPTGFSTATGGTSNRITTASASFANTLLDDLLIPQAATFTVAGPLYCVEETKPFWMQTSSLVWTLATGEITLATPSLRFVRQQEDDDLAASAAVLAVPAHARRISNDGYFRNIATANGPAVIRADARGAALLTVDVNLAGADLRPHFPYTSSSSAPIPASGGRIVINDDVIDTVRSALQLAGPVPISYARDCPDTNCAGVQVVGPAILQFTADASQLAFTPDGGLLGNGAVPPQNLTWGYYGGGDFAQRTSDVQAGAFQMPGTFLRGDQTALNDGNRPSVLLLTGNGNGADTAYRERPGDAGYPRGLANYAGVNFRAPALARSHLANFLSDWYPLVPEAKYYARAGGISGIHQAETFPATLILYGYRFTFARYALSYLDSQNWQSLTDGSVHLPGPDDAPAGPAGFDQEFAELKLLCRGGIGGARVPETSGEKYLSYWNTYFTPLSFTFQPKAGDGCGTGNRYLVLGVQTTLPFIPQELHAAIGVKSNGNLVTVADAVLGVDSRFGVPAELSLAGPAGGKYRLLTGSEGYFNNWETPGRPDAGFYNLAGKLDLPFFQDSKVHLHVVPVTRQNADVYVMGGWRAADKADDHFGWNTPDHKNYFNYAKFDETHRGFPGATADDYRNHNGPEFHPRAEREWLELVKFDYPLLWNKATHRFVSFQDEKVEFPIIDVGSRLKTLTPGMLDIDFSQDLDLSLPRIKLLDFANDAIDELNKPLLSVSNAVMSSFTDLADAVALSKGFLSMQKLLRDTPEHLFRPVLDPLLDPALDALFPALSALSPVNPGYLRQVSNTVFAPSSQIRTAVQNINQINSLFGDVNRALRDVDDTLGLFIRIVGKDASGKRQAVRVIIQQIVKDQGPELGLLGDALGGLADNALNDQLAELEPTLAEVEIELKTARIKVDALRSQLSSATGDFTKALSAATGSAANLDEFAALAGGAVSSLVALSDNSQHDFLTANPADARRQIKQRIITAFLNSKITGKYQQTLKQFLYDDNAEISQVTETFFQQINAAIRNAVQDAIASATDTGYKGSKGGGMIAGTLLAAKIRGAAEFNADALRKIRLDADVQMNLPDEMNFGAFIEIKELDSSNTPNGCIPPGGPSVEISLGARHVPLGWAGIGDALNVDVTARWDLNQGRVFGVGGSIELNGKFDLKSVTIEYLGAALGIGEYESYFAARAKGTATFGGYGFGAEVGFFAGKTCRIDPLKMVDPDVEKIVKNPNDFSGVYVQFGGVFPLTQIIGIPASCLFRADGVANTAIYYEGGPRFGTFGGRQTIGVNVELICLISGSVRFTTFIRVSSGEILLGADAEVCAEIGSCPFCLEACAGISVKGTMTDGDIDYSVDF